MKTISWNTEKNNALHRERGVCFEQVVMILERDDVLDIIQHPNSVQYPNQKVFIIEINNYAYLVPFVEDDNEIFLKTIIPSRKATKQYLREMP